MKSSEFYQKYIQKEYHIIGGSLAIKKQILSFREPNDIDIMIDCNFLINLIEICKNENLELIRSKYNQSGIMSINFEDKKLDFMFSGLGKLKNNKTIKIGNTLFLTLKEIINYKFVLIARSINSGMFNFDNKHLNDIQFILNNTYEQNN